MTGGLPPDLKELSKKRIVVLSLDEADATALDKSRRGGRRFSKNFPHDEVGEVAKNALAIILTENSPTLAVGLISSKSATSTFETRVVFDHVKSVVGPRYNRLLNAINAPSLRRRRDDMRDLEPGLHSFSPKLGLAFLMQLAASEEALGALRSISTLIQRPGRITDARALQDDAVRLAIKAFGGPNEASHLALNEGGSTALGTVRLLEDAVIEHDARSISGLRLADSDLTGRARFEGRDRALEVLTANKRPLEELFGVDLIYLNRRRGSIVMVQYKMLERGTSRKRSVKSGSSTVQVDDGHDWLLRVDEQLEDEIARMKRFDRDMSPSGPYRLNAGAFFLKFMRRNAEAKSAGFLVSLDHFERLRAENKLAGPRGGIRLSYRELDGHYLRSGGFAELVQSGYVGTRGATTAHLQALIERTLSGGHAAVVAIESALTSPA